jgi:hypothetical protein
LIVANHAGAPSSSWYLVCPVRIDGGDIPSIPRVERRSQLFLADGVRASIGTLVTEAQDIQASIVLGHRRQTRHVSSPLVAVEGGTVRSPAPSQTRAPTLQEERISRPGNFVPSCT